MTVAQILARSSNVGAITLAERLGAARDWPAGSRASASAARRGSTSRRGPGIALPRRGTWSGSTIGNVPDRPGDLRHAHPARGRLLGDREPRRLDPAAPGRPHRRRRLRARRPAPDRLGRVARQVILMLKNVVARGHRHAGSGAGLRRSPARPVRPEARRDGYSKSQLVASFVGIVPASQPAARRPGVGRRAAGSDLRWRRRGPGVLRSRSSTCSTWTEASLRTLRPPRTRPERHNCCELRYVVPIAIAWRDRPTLLVGAVLDDPAHGRAAASLVPALVPGGARRAPSRMSTAAASIGRTAIRARHSLSSGTRSPRRTTRGR